MSFSLTDEQDYPRITAAVKWIIALNVAVMFVSYTLVSPDDIYSLLGFQRNRFTSTWWSALSYMFVHGGLLHIGVNMYMLWIFGPRLEHAWGTASFTRFYLWCGLGGLIAHALLGMNGTLIGASAAIYGVLLGYAVSWPDEEVLFFGVIPMKVRTLVLGLIGVNLVAGILSAASAGGIAYFAHLGGVAFGWLYIRTPAAGSLDRIRHRISPVPDETDEPPRAIPRSLPRNRERLSEIDEIVARSNAMAARRQSAVLPPRKASEAAPANAEALNVVLDKISERGLESLTDAERRLLEELSREMRRKK